MQNRAISILLILGIIVVVNLLSRQFFVRLDLTADKQYTLSDATKDILRDLDQTVTVTAYFTESIPPDLEQYRTEFRDMLVEYATRSSGNVEYRFINPNEDETTEQEAAQNGIQPRLVNVREKDQFTQQRVYMGAVLNLGDQQEVMPFIGPGIPMEYSLTTAIKKMASVDKPSVAFLTGNGEPGFTQMGQVYQALSVVFSVEAVDLNVEEEIPPRFRSVVMVAPADSVSPVVLGKLDRYLGNGGRLIVAVNAVAGNFQTAQGTAAESSLIPWLRGKGIEVEQSFVVDVSSGTVTVQQRQGPFTINTPVQFHYLPLVTSFPDHPATQGIEQVMLQFASPVRYLGDSSSRFTPLVTSSRQSGIVPAPVFFDVGNRQWTEQDFPLSNVTMAGLLEGNVNGNPGAKLVVFGDGDFPLSPDGRAINPDNANLLVNTVEWLSDDTGLTALRTKGVSSRPIEEMDDAKRQMLKYLNFLLPIILAIGYGLFRSQRNKARRLRRMQERYV